MARRSETDRWLFVVTLALCLLGAVMIFSASAVTAQQMYGHSYVFVLRQVVWLLAGLAGMKKQLESFTDVYEKLGTHLRHAQQSYEDADSKLGNDESDNGND